MLSLTSKTSLIFEFPSEIVLNGDASLPKVNCSSAIPPDEHVPVLFTENVAGFLLASVVKIVYVAIYFPNSSFSEKSISLISVKLIPVFEVHRVPAFRIGNCDFVGKYPSVKSAASIVKTKSMSQKAGDAPLILTPARRISLSTFLRSTAVSRLSSLNW